MTQINQQQEKKLMKQLDFLWENTFEMNSYFHIIKQYLENSSCYRNQIRLSPTFYHYIYNALVVATFSEVSKMYDKNSKTNIFKFLDYCKKNSNLLFLIHKRSGAGNCEEDRIKKMLFSFDENLKKLTPKLNNLKTQRDKVYAHNDSQKMEDIEKLIHKNPVLIKDMEELIKLVTEVLQYIYALLTKIVRNKVVKDISDWENTLLKLKEIRLDDRQ